VRFQDQGLGQGCIGEDCASDVVPKYEAVLDYLTAGVENVDVCGWLVALEEIGADFMVLGVTLCYLFFGWVVAAKDLVADGGRDFQR